MDLTDTDFAVRPMQLARLAAMELVERGYAVVRVADCFAACIDIIFERADTFFAAPLERKSGFERPDILEGYRGFGAEFSESPDRRDLNETFSLVLRNMDRGDLADWPAANPLHSALRSAAPLYVDFLHGVFEELRLSFNPAGDRIEPADFSYFQLNYYRPGQESRELLQDAHEDGHLLTLVMSRQPGLEIEVDGRFRPVLLDRDELLIMPGSILTLMTGGRIEPLVHRVRNVPGLKTRASLMFFTNASVTQPPRVWAPAPDGSMPDVGRATARASQLFGLDSIESITR